MTSLEIYDPVGHRVSGMPGFLAASFAEVVDLDGNCPGDDGSDLGHRSTPHTVLAKSSNQAGLDGRPSWRLCIPTLSCTPRQLLRLS